MSKIHLTTIVALLFASFLTITSIGPSAAAFSGLTAREWLDPLEKPADSSDQRPGEVALHEVKMQAPVIWALNFHFRDPREIVVDIPGRGKMRYWYLWYQVSNPSDQEVLFMPRFELATEKSTTHFDAVFPAVQRAIQLTEDPQNQRNIQNSVTISAKPLPASRKVNDKGQPIAIPEKTTAVAIWENVPLDTKSISIFVNGLSNEWSIDENKVQRHKTLKLNFTRDGDSFRFVPPAESFHRSIGGRPKPIDK